MNDNPYVNRALGPDTLRSSAGTTLGLLAVAFELNRIYNWLSKEDQKEASDGSRETGRV